MDLNGYTQSLKARIIKVNENSVTINIRNIDKDLPATPEQIERIKNGRFQEGQLVQLLYTSKEHWMIKEINLDITEERRYFRKDDI